MSEYNINRNCWKKIFFEGPGEIMANETAKNEPTLEEQIDATTAGQKLEEKAKK